VWNSFKTRDSFSKSPYGTNSINSTAVKKEDTMKKRVGIKSLRKKSVSFKPNRDFLQKAISEYLEKGGKITKLEFDEKAYKNFISRPEAPTAVDDFLAGR